MLEIILISGWENIQHVYILMIREFYKGMIKNLGRADFMSLLKRITAHLYFQLTYVDEKNPIFFLLNNFSQCVPLKQYQFVVYLIINNFIMKFHFHPYLFKIYFIYIVAKIVKVTNYAMILKTCDFSI